MTDQPIEDNYFEHPLTERFEAALLLACKLHRAQVRKGTLIPYISHLLAVASLALEHGASEDEAIAAILHDAVEDQGGADTAGRIGEMFGETVAELVLSCSDSHETPKPPWRARKEAYVAHVLVASPGARLISACDKLHNARSILSDYREHGDSLWQRFTGGREGTLWYYRSLSDAFASHGSTPLVRELERVVSELERLSAMNGVP